MVTVVANSSFDLRDTEFPAASTFSVLSFVTAQSVSLGVSDGSFAIFGPFSQSNPNDIVTSATFTLDNGRLVSTISDLNLNEADLTTIFDGSTRQVLSRIFNGADTFIGSADSDAFGGFRGKDIINGGRGGDLLAGGKGADKISGGQGRDRIEGGAGNDKINGGKGADQLAGDAGNDRFIFNGRSGNDTIVDFTDGEDRIVIKAAGGIGDLRIDQVDTDTVITFERTTITLLNFDSTDLTTADFIF